MSVIRQEPPSSEAKRPFGNHLFQRIDRSAPTVFILPALLLVLTLSIFPLIVSLYLAFTQVRIAQGGFDITFTGLANFEKLLFGREQRHLIGKIGEPTLIGWLVFAIVATLLIWRLFHLVQNSRVAPTKGWLGIAATLVLGLAVGQGLYATYGGEEAILGRGGMVVAGALLTFMGLRLLSLLISKALPSDWREVGVFIGRLMAITIALILMWIVIHTLNTVPNEEGNATGLPGTLIVTLYFAILGVILQYLIGLGLALLLTSDLFGKRFFRVIFLLPMMITPVGVAYMFRMVANTSIGPLTPIFRTVFGVSGDYSWAAQAESARVGVLLADIWQWTPFIFIVLVAALEGMPNELREAALVDGANSWQFFRYITIPQILPVSTTVVLIRLIEAFKITDLPFVMTRGGPGTATESMTLHAYAAFKSSDFGGSAAVAYILLFVVTYIGLNYADSVRKVLAEAS